MTSPTRARNTARAISARSVIWLPQEAPIRLYATSSWAIPTSPAIAVRTTGTSVVESRGRVCTRTWLSPMVLTMESSRSGRPVWSKASRIESTVEEVTVVGALKSAPPRNSMPKTSPRTSRAITESAIRIADSRYHRRRRPMKS
jgi:hypothetical protein